LLSGRVTDPSVLRAQYAVAPDGPLEALPVPAEMFVYTADEYQRLVARGDRFADMIRRSVVWVSPSTV